MIYKFVNISHVLKNIIASQWLQKLKCWSHRHIKPPSIFWAKSPHLFANWATRQRQASQYLLIICYKSQINKIYYSTLTKNKITKQIKRLLMVTRPFIVSGLSWWRSWATFFFQKIKILSQYYRNYYYIYIVIHNILLIIWLFILGFSK